MNKLLICVTLGASLVLTACGEPVERMATTPSGRPEAIFRGRTQGQVATRLASHCLERGLMVDEHTDNRVVCRGRLEGGAAFAAQLLIGNSYSTPPEGILTFSFVQQGRDVRAYGRGEVVTQMAYGQIRRVESNGNADFNSLMQAMITVGGEAP